MWVSDDDHLYPVLQQKLSNKVPEINVPSAPSSKGNPAAQSQWSIARQCPTCAHQMFLFDYTEATKTYWVQCKQGHIWCNQDLENDAVFRQIPEEMVIRWSRAIDRKKQREENGQ